MTRSTFALMIAAVSLAGCGDSTTGATGTTEGWPQTPPRGGVTLPQVNLGIQMYIPYCPCPTVGGSASVLRTDTAGQEAVTLDLQRTGTVFIAFRHFRNAAYRITYAPPAGYVMAPGAANPQDVTVTDALQWVVFDVRRAPETAP